MKLGTETASVVNHLMSGPTQADPKIGDGATVLHWTDRTACTVIAWDGKVLTVQEDQSTRTDGNGMSESQDYSYAPDPNGRTFTFKRDRKGAWRQCEQGARNRMMTHGHGLTIGVRRAYHDFSF